MPYSNLSEGLFDNLFKSKKLNLSDEEKLEVKTKAYKKYKSIHSKLKSVADKSISKLGSKFKKGFSVCSPGKISVEYDVDFIQQKDPDTKKTGYYTSFMFIHTNMWDVYPKARNEYDDVNDEWESIIDIVVNDLKEYCKSSHMNILIDYDGDWDGGFITVNLPYESINEGTILKEGNGTMADNILGSEHLDSIFKADRDDVVHTFVVSTDLSKVEDSGEVLYRYPEFNKGINEHMDLSDRTTRKILLRLDEAGQSTVLTSLTSKLYDNIVNKIDDIDYGDIPATKGDITKLPNYAKIIDSIETMRALLKEYKQDTAPLDEIATAVANVETRKDLFQRGYRYNTEMVMVMYCNVTLAIIASISYMIATSVEFIKTPNQDSFSVALDKVRYAKSKDYVLYDCLKKFNNACKNGTFDKSMETVLQSKIKNLDGTSIGGLAIVAVSSLLLIIVPLLREMVFVFYYMRMRVSDFFDIQADMLQMNAYNIQADQLKNPEEKDRVVAKQLKIVDMFRKAANFFSITSKKAEIDADKEYKKDNKKYKIDEVIDEVPAGTSALF